MWLRDGTDVDTINRQMPQWEQRNIPDQTFGEQTVNQGDFADWRLVNVRDVHLGPAQDGSQGTGNDERKPTPMRDFEAVGAENPRSATRKRATSSR